MVLWYLYVIIKHKLLFQMLIADDHFRNMPVGALSPSLSMQQKQQQNLLNRKNSITNDPVPTTSTSTQKQRKGNSFWNHFGIGVSTSKGDVDVPNGNRKLSDPTTVIDQQNGFSPNSNGDAIDQGYGVTSAPR